MHTVDGGVTWALQTTGVQTTFAGIYFIDSLSGWAVGTLARIMHTADGGQTWETQHYNPPLLTLYDVHFLDSLHGWAAGVSGVFYTADGGQTWTQQDARAGGLWSLSFANDQSIWVAGSGCGILKYKACETSAVGEAKNNPAQLFNIYPNPATDQVTIVNNSLVDVDRVVLYNAMGVKIKTVSVRIPAGESIILPLPAHGNGLYLLALESDAPGGMLVVKRLPVFDR